MTQSIKSIKVICNARNVVHKLESEARVWLPVIAQNFWWFFIRQCYFIAVYAVVMCLSICLSVCLSVTHRYCAKTAKLMIT